MAGSNHRQSQVEEHGTSFFCLTRFYGLRPGPVLRYALLLLYEALIFIKLIS